MLLELHRELCDCYVEQSSSLNYWSCYNTLGDQSHCNILKTYSHTPGAASQNSGGNQAVHFGCTENMQRSTRLRNQKWQQDKHHLIIKVCFCKVDWMSWKSLTTHNGNQNTLYIIDPLISTGYKLILKSLTGFTSQKFGFRYYSFSNIQITELYHIWYTS